MYLLYCWWICLIFNTCTTKVALVQRGDLVENWVAYLYKIKKTILKTIKILDRFQHFPKELSSGEQQRVAIARAIIAETNIILADEPTGNLDSKSGIEIMKILHELYAKGNTIILVTHEQEIAMHANRIITIFDGKIKEDRLNKDMTKAL